MSQTLRNIGFLFFNHSQVYSNEQESKLFLDEAEHLIGEAINFASNNESLLLDLGLIKLAKGQISEAETTWRDLDFAADYFIDWGNSVRVSGSLDEAVVWYERSRNAAPSVGDPWFYEAVIFQDQKNYREAEAAFNQVLLYSDFSSVSLSEVLFKRGLFFELTPGYQNLDEALEMYNKAIESDTFPSTLMKADAVYKRGEVFRLQERDPEFSIAEYQKAISILPGHRWAHLRLGFALYNVNKDLESAIFELEKAISYWPKEDITAKIPFLLMGEIFLDAGLEADALAAFEKALQKDPVDETIREKIKILRE